MKWVFLPGMEGSGLLFEPVISHLPTNVEPIIINYPCNLPLDYEALTLRVEQSVPKHSPYILVAESFSGPIGYEIALKRPKHLQGLVLVASFVTRPESRALKLCRLKPMLWLMKLPYPSGFLKASLLGREASPEFVALFSKAMAKVSLEVLQCRAEAMWMLPEQPESIDLPCLYLQASHDKLVTSASLKTCQSLMPHLKMEQINASHFILQTNPDESLKAIAEFSRTL